MRLGNARQVRIEIGAVARADQLLHDHRHLIPADSIGRAAQKRSRIAEPGGCVDQLDRRDQLVAANGKIRMVVRHHIGFVKAGEGMVVHVLEQTGASDGQGQVDRFQVAAQLIRQPVGHGGLDEGPGDAFVRSVDHRGWVQGVVGDEGIESFGGDDQGLRHTDDHVRIAFLQVRRPAQQVGHEGQAPGLAAQGAVADFDEVG